MRRGYHFDTIRKPRKAPVSRVGLKRGESVLYSLQAIARYKKLHEDNFKKEYPLMYRDGQYFFDQPNGTMTNKLTDMVCNALKWMGHLSNRIDVKGTAVIDKNHAPSYDVVSGKIKTQTKVSFRPTKTESGTGDIDCKLIHSKHPFGVPWEIEIKFGRDTQSDKQERREAKLKAHGLWYDVIKTLDDFFEKYDSKMEILNG